MAELLQTRTLVISDMDGTMLSHDGYQYEALLPMLDSLKQQSIPVVLNSSKTRAELQHWVGQLQLHAPFVTENGSAIYLAANDFSREQMSKTLSVPGFEIQQTDEYFIVVFGVEVNELQQFIDQSLARFNPSVVDLSRCSLEVAIQVTGLCEDEARQAQQREFSVPLLFEDDRIQQQFREQAIDAGYGVLQGGRFLHLLGKVDKGRALQRVKQFYQQLWNVEINTIALGDSPNDLDMLLAADVAVRVNNPAAKSFEIPHKKLIVTQQPAPQGWVEGMESALQMFK